jgi:predicted glycosyltransferase
MRAVKNSKKRERAGRPATVISAGREGGGRDGQELVYAFVSAGASVVTKNHQVLLGPISSFPGTSQLLHLMEAVIIDISNVFWSDRDCRSRPDMPPDQLP